jgi:hypothetical protein
MLGLETKKIIGNIEEEFIGNVVFKWNIPGTAGIYDCDGGGDGIAPPPPPTPFLQHAAELEFLNSLWGLGTE